MDKRYARLLACVGEFETVAVAFSAGADSTLLLAAAKEALGGSRVLALTVVTPYMKRQEVADAVGLCDQLGVRLELVEMPMPVGMETNPPDRCYRCKRAMYETLLVTASGLGYKTVLDGRDSDDAYDPRPGARALHELQIRSPLVECQIGKDLACRMVRSLRLATGQRPANACLLTRLPFNARVSMERLQQIEEAERFLGARGYESVRVRLHGDLARIEVAPAQRRQLLDDAGAVVNALRELGLRHVMMDLLGYQHGPMGGPPGRGDTD